MTTPDPSPTPPRPGRCWTATPASSSRCPRRPSGWGSRAGRPTSWPARAASPTTRLGARDLHVPAAVLRRIEQEGLPPAPESDGGEVA